jgi:hypothetical protein
MKLIMKTLFLLSLLLTAATAAYAQSNEQQVTVTVKPSQSVEERVADSIREKELRATAEEELAARRSARAAARSPRALLSRAQTVYICSNTSYFEAVQLQNELRKRAEFDAWEMAILDGWDKGNAADIRIEIDRPLFTFTFTYKVTDRATSILLASGKITAIDGNAAAPILAERIVQDIKKARGESVSKK